MANTVFRCDNMPGIDQRTEICSVLVQDAEGKAIAVENGAIVEIGALVAADGKTEHDLYTAKLATASSDLKKCAVIGTPEVEYDECRRKNLDDFKNEAGVPAAAYRIRLGGVFSVTKEGFVSGTAPTAIGAAVGLGANGKIDASGSGLGTVLDIDKTSRYTFYAINL